MINRLVALALSFCVLGFISCRDEDHCGCTLALCRDGVLVTVESEGGEIFPEGEYVLLWEAGDFNNEVGIDTWDYNDDPTKKMFYIPRRSSSGEYLLTEYTETITLELFLDGESVSDGEVFDLFWVTTECNICTGPCEDLVTNAEIEMVVTPP